MDWNKISAELNKRLDPANIRPAKQFGPKGDYIEGWHAIAEANRIFGHDGWSYSLKDVKCVSERPREIGKNKTPGYAVSYIASIYVDVMGGVRREDVGAGHGYDVDCGLAHESAIKEAVTDALKRALRTFGNPFGLALYDKTREGVGVDASEAEVETAISAINASADLDALRRNWSSLYANARHVADDARVIAAKESRKGELTMKETHQGAG